MILAAMSFLQANVPGLAQEGSNVLPDAGSREVAESYVQDLCMRVNRLLGIPKYMIDQAADTIGVVVELIDSMQYVEIDGGAVPHTGRVNLIIAKDVDFSAESEPRTRTFKVYIDSATSRLLKIESILPSYHAKIEEGRMRERPTAAPGGTALPFGSWEYVGLPDKEPGVSLSEATKAVFGNVAAADRIVARYLVVQHPTFGTKHAWVIETWISWVIVPSGGAKIEEHQASYLCTIVDDEGKLLVGGN